MKGHVTDQLRRGVPLSQNDERHLSGCRSCQAAVADDHALDEQLRVAARPLAAQPLPHGLLEQHIVAQASGVPWGPAAVIVVLLAVVVGLGIGSGLPQVGGPSPSLNPSPSASPSPSVSPSASTDASARPSPRTDVRADLVAGPAACANGTTGFELWVPDGWFTNAAAFGADACRFFAPVQFDPAAASAAVITSYVVDGGLSQAEAVLESKEQLERTNVELGGSPAARLVGRSGPGERVGYVIALDHPAVLADSRKLLVIVTRPGATSEGRDAAALDQIVERFSPLEPLTTSPAVAVRSDALLADAADCATDEYRLSYPGDWSRATECTNFGPGALGGLAFGTGGTVITVETIRGDIGFTDNGVVAMESTVVANRPAVRFEVRDGEGRRAYHYLVQLGETEEQGPNIVATTSDVVPDYELAKAVLDRMMATLRIGPGQANDFSLVTDAHLIGATLTAVGVGDGQVVAGGSTCSSGSVPVCDPAVWLSDDGLHWTAPVRLPKFDDNSRIFSITHGPTGWVAVGDGLWFSKDGASWEKARVSLDPAGDGGPLYDGGSEMGCCGVEMRDVISTSSGWVLVGGVDCFKCGYRAAIWFSDDGRSWERVSYSSSFEGSVMASIHALRDGRLVAVGGRQSWTSDDGGHTWRGHQVFPPEEGVAVAVNDDRTQLFAVTSSPLVGEGRLWSSTDGASWTSRQLPGLSNSNVTAAEVIHGTLYLAVGHYTDITTSVGELLRLTDEGALEAVSAEGGSAALISGFAELPNGAIAVGRLDTNVADDGRLGGIWIAAR